MKAFTLTGNDTYRITQFIQQQKHNLDPIWAIFNVQNFSFDQLEAALMVEKLRLFPTPYS